MVITSFLVAVNWMGAYEKGTEEVREQDKRDLFAPHEYQVTRDLITADICIRRTLNKVAEGASE